MKRLFTVIFALMSLVLITDPSEAQEPIRHDLEIVLYPEEHRLTAKDTITVPKGLLPGFQFNLHQGLAPSSPTQGVQIVRETRRPGTIPLESFKVILSSGQNTFVLEYGGKIYHPLEPYGKERARGFRQTPGRISGEGVYLTGSSFWYPIIGDRLVTFSLHVELPSTWDAVSQGERTQPIRKGNTTSVRWESPEPQDEIFMVAAPFIEYTQHAGPVKTMVFLRKPDAELANKYLDATTRYMNMYERLIGPYPYKKFALVENFWETGLGMPSFTLLGPKIIRFPFILHSSYPHEILHNWWGNSVFPDPTKGNWSEGLTAYLSDHTIKEQRGHAAKYRQETLQKYVDYVLRERDFPLVQFRSRHSSPSEAVGYGKSLMFFHMLRMQLGDKAFVHGLQAFYQKNKFRFATFDDLRIRFEGAYGKDLRREFNQWIIKTGAPEIKVSRAKARAEGNGYVLTTIANQVQPGSAYRLRIPVAVTMKEHDQAYQTVVVMEEKHLELKIRVPARPLRLDVDPEFDLFRKLDRDEIPPALTQAFGARKMLILLPSSEQDRLVQAYRELSQSLSHSGPVEVEVRRDRGLKRLPSDRAVTVLGWDNLFQSEMASALSGYDVAITQRGVRIGRTELLRKDHSVVLTARNPENKDLSMTWIASDLPEALSGLGRKLPHYHKYSYLGFEGKEPANVAKGRWPVLNSPMTVFIPLEGGTIPKVEMGKLAPREPLAILPAIFSKKGMMEIIRFLSNDELRGRGLGTKGLDLAAEFIAKRFKDAGLSPAGDGEGSYFQSWKGRAGDPERRGMMRNVIGVIPGKRPEFEGQSVVVGGHYDHLGLGWPEVREEKHRGKIHPGADDNASGVAVVIELARVLGKSMKPERSVVFVAFTGEEAGRKGSKYYVANQKRYPLEQCIGMVNLDTVGRLGKNKLLVIGAGSAREWVHIYRGAGYVTGVDVEVVSEELDSSDQKSFQEAGVPAVQMFSGPHLDYHRPTDTAEKIDPEGLLKVASVAKEVVEYLANRAEPMTSTLTPGGGIESTTKKARRVSLGTIPDFAFRGDGYRISGVVPGSPADLCGLEKGDVIVRIDSDGVHNLKDLSVILKSLNPGDRISIAFRREGKEMTVEAELVGKSY